MIRQAQYQAEIETQKARAAQAGPLSEASARQAVVAEEVRVERMRTQELILVQEQEVLRRQKELEATVIKPAEADRLAAVVRAEAAKQSAILEAEGRRSAMIALAEAEQEKLRKEGMGRAAAVEAEGRAEAAKIEAIGLAQAKAIEAQGVAEAPPFFARPKRGRNSTTPRGLQAILEKMPAISRRRPASSAPLPRRSRHRQARRDRPGNGADGGRAALDGSRRPAAVVFSLLQRPSARTERAVNAAAAA